jgi:hypothetical protein
VSKHTERLTVDEFQEKVSLVGAQLHGLRLDDTATLLAYFLGGLLVGLPDLAQIEALRHFSRKVAEARTMVKACGGLRAVQAKDFDRCEAEDREKAN